MFVKGGVSYIQLAQLDNVAAVDFGFMSCNSEVRSAARLTRQPQTSLSLFRRRV